MFPRIDKSSFIFWISLALLCAASGCSDSADNGQPGPTDVEDADIRQEEDAADAADSSSPEAATLEVAPDPLLLPDPQGSGETSAQLQLKNIGGAPLLIKSARLEHLPEGRSDSSTFFEDSTTWSALPETLDRGESLALRVKYSPAADGPTEAQVVIESDDPDTPTLKVPVQLTSLSPKVAAPAQVEFDAVDPPETLPGGYQPDWMGVFELISIENTGDAALSIDSIELEGSAEFSVSFPPSTDQERDHNPEDDSKTPPTFIEPGARAPVRVWFHPTDTSPQHDRLLIRSNDPEEPSFRVRLSGNPEPPCARITPQTVTFGDVDLDESEVESFRVRNCSESTPLTISEVSIEDSAEGAFELEEAFSEVELGPREARSFSLRFTPRQTGRADGSITVRTSADEGAATTINLEASGVDAACPIPVAGAYIESDNPDDAQSSLQAPVDIMLRLDATDSEHPTPGRTVSYYEWTLLSAPSQSDAIIEDYSSATPTFTPDAVGAYQFALEVRDDIQVPSSRCGEPAIVEFEALAPADVTVQLTWERANGPRRGSYADLNLIYGHENAGAWDHPRLIVNYDNPAPDWNTAEAGRVGNPRLLQTSYTGGPETLVHSDLGDFWYLIGVYYYASSTDPTYGEAKADLRIYLDGTERFAISDDQLTEGEFWTVAELDSGPFSISIEEINEFENW